jgi:NAD(P)-dependent dehydrogenase (short-subunit alcohol dehydrogenase family)
MAQTGKVALVTGAGSGIGRATALALVEAGWAVALAGRRENALAETTGLAKPGQDVRSFVADVTEPAAVTALFEAVVSAFGRLDLLFNNAGANAPAVPFDELPFDAWKNVIDVNLTGSFLCAQAAFRQFKAQTPRGGRIINNGSVSAHVPRPLSAAYTASKHAITGLTRSLSLDGRAHDITCGQIDVGNAQTELTQRMRTTGALQANGQFETEPLMDVANVANSVVFMSGLAPEANIQFLTITAAKMKFIARG